MATHLIVLRNGVTLPASQPQAQAVVEHLRQRATGSAHGRLAPGELSFIDVPGLFVHAGEVVAVVPTS